MGDTLRFEKNKSRLSGVTYLSDQLGRRIYEGSSVPHVNQGVKSYTFHDREDAMRVNEIAGLYISSG